MNEEQRRHLMLELLALAREHPELIVVEDRHEPPPLPIPEPITIDFDDLPRPNQRAAPHRGKGLLELMRGLGAA